MTPTNQTDGMKPAVGPDDLENVPGLGAVRIRSLRKAGLDTVTKLRSARMEQLTAVPGINETTARRVLDYLADGGGQAVVSQRPEPEAAAAPAEPASRLAQAATELETAARALLAAPDATEFGPRLARQIAKAAALAEACGQPDGVRRKGRKKLARGLRDAARLLADALARSPLGGKRQARLTEQLRRRRRSLGRYVKR